MRVRDAGAIQRWRQRRGFSQRDLAHLVGCSQAAISLIERGGLATVSEELSQKLAVRLQVPWDDLFED